MTTRPDHRRKPPRPSLVGIQQSTTALRRARRRSSARFLHLAREQPSNDDEPQQQQAAADDETTGNMQELYKKAIRMNAENKINASNSWSLRLIENIDNFLEEDEYKEEEEDDEEQLTAGDESANNNNSNNATTPSEKPGRRVNFTKASCTLDASVKIYSYRVDDVHLTSYKVLANLHRNSQSTKPAATAAATSTQEQQPGAETRRSPVNTLETNMANLNLNKLDSAFDIDPLFSKMSKAFDEGGAKGLLLANLGVGAAGCNIVFDSTTAEGEEEENDTAATQNTEGITDIAFLTTKLQDQLEADDDGDVEALPLVPQLASLRAEYAQLEEQGFVTTDGDAAATNSTPRNNNRRYGVTEEEEQEADRSIHQEALERSRASLGRSFVADEEENDSNEGPMLPIIGDFDDGDDNDDHSMGGGLFPGDDDADNFAPRFSNFSDRSSIQHEEQTQRTAALLDMMSDSQALWTQSDDRVYWKAPENQWAGAVHWKKSRPKVATTAAAAAPATATATKTPRKTPKKTRRGTAPVLVDLTRSNQINLNDLLLASQQKKKKKKAAATSTTTWSDSTVNKHGKNENVLPLDAGIGVPQLTSLFLRPQWTMSSAATRSASAGAALPSKKTVGFADFEPVGGGDDGPGFFMNPTDGDDDDDDDDEYVVAPLEGVRQVETVRVGYATVAKKVDVKRLKQDLWQEVQGQLQMEEDGQQQDKEETTEEDDPPASARCLSFQKAVQDMEISKSQPDVTLPFYFICILHLANEKGLRLDSQGLEDFTIHAD